MHPLEGYFYELTNEKNVGCLVRRSKVLYEKQSQYQKIEIFENPVWGRTMILDGCVMLSERDEFTYHEMLVHPALLSHPAPKDVLVVGGGDGGTLREVVKHPSVENAVLCEIDNDVIESSREFLPFTACGLDHPKSRVFVGDGLEYIRQHKASFDVVIVDSTDPVGFAAGLFMQPFYLDVLAALRPGGVFVQQTESPFFDLAVWKNVYTELKKSFRSVRPYGCAIPMYPSGYWTFAIGAAQAGAMPGNDAAARIAALGQLKYFRPEMLDAAFVLPAFAHKTFQEA